jgi:predicted lactoylglutathione lyase
VTHHASRKLFVNLAVRDLDRAVEFFKALGFEFDPRFTDETATCMLVGEDAYVMLLTREKFAEFAAKPVADPGAATEALISLSCESRDEVDAFAEKAIAAGGSPAKEPLELDFMYGRSFYDPDGHHWEIFWMDPATIEQGPEAVAEPSHAT